MPLTSYEGPKSGIKPHSDKNNFIITCHLALDVPEGECWIQVGDTKYEWKNGKAVIFDTSIMHSTDNFSEKERYVLLIRFWHPQLTKQEQNAFKYVTWKIFVYVLLFYLNYICFCAVIILFYHYSQI